MTTRRFRQPFLPTSTAFVDVRAQKAEGQSSTDCSESTFTQELANEDEKEQFASMVMLMANVALPALGWSEEQIQVLHQDQRLANAVRELCRSARFLNWVAWVVTAKKVAV